MVKSNQQGMHMKYEGLAKSKSTVRSSFRSGNEQPANDEDGSCTHSWTKA